MEFPTKIEILVWILLFVGFLVEPTVDFFLQ